MKTWQRWGGKILFFLLLLGYVVPLTPAMPAEANPAQLVEEAKLAIDQARKAGAEQAASDDLAAAKSWLLQAEKSLGESKSVLSRLSTAKMKTAKEEAVVFLATMAKLKAMTALAKAQRKTTLAELRDTQKDLTDYQSALTVLKEKIALANQAKEVQAKAEAERRQLEAAQQKVAELETLKKKELQDVRRGTAELEARKEKEARDAQLKEARLAAEKEKTDMEAKLKVAAMEAQHAKEAMELQAKEEKLSAEQSKLALLQAKMQALEREKALLAAAGNIPNAALKLGDKKIILNIPAGNLFTAANELNPSGKEILNSIGKILKAYPESKATVRGHTDNRGKAEANQAMSEKRAQKVREYLVTYQNIPPQQITAEGLGAAQPVATNATEAGRSQNRRVEVIIPLGG